MRSAPTALRRLAVLSPGLLLALALACASSGPERPTQSVVEDELGFTITEEVRIGSGARGDFEEALERIDEERFADAIALLEGVVEEAPLVTTAHLDLGIAYARAGELESARTSLERALELSPRHPAVHNELGIVYRRLGRFEDARRSYQGALAVYPDFHFARRNLAILCDLYLGDAECAMEHYGIYAQAMPEDETVAMWIADLRNRMGRQTP